MQQPEERAAWSTFPATHFRPSLGTLRCSLRIPEVSRSPQRLPEVPQHVPPPSRPSPESFICFHGSQKRGEDGEVLREPPRLRRKPDKVYGSPRGRNLRPDTNIQEALEVVGRWGLGFPNSGGGKERALVWSQRKWQDQCDRTAGRARALLAVGPGSIPNTLIVSKPHQE